MRKALVTYYSWSGHTRQIAEAIAAELGADVEPIREVNSRSGWIAYFRSAWEALQGKSAAIADVKNSVSAYDLVVLGTPVWAGRMSSPLRTYILQQRDKLARIAVFCSEGGANGDRAIRQVAELCGRVPVARLVVTEPELASGAYRQKVAEFTKALK